MEEFDTIVFNTLRKKTYYVIFFSYEKLCPEYGNENCRFDLILGSFLGNVVLQHNLTKTTLALIYGDTILSI